MAIPPNLARSVEEQLADLDGLFEDPVTYRRNTLAAADAHFKVLADRAAAYFDDATKISSEHRMVIEGLSGCNRRISTWRGRVAGLDEKIDPTRLREELACMTKAQFDHALVLVVSRPDSLAALEALSGAHRRAVQSLLDAELRAANQDQERRLREQDRLIQGLRDELHDAQERVGQVRSAAMDQENAFRDQITELQRDALALRTRAEQAEGATHTSAAEVEIEALHTKLAASERDARQHADTIHDLNDLIRCRQEEAETKQAALDASRADVARLQSETADLHHQVETGTHTCSLLQRRVDEAEAEVASAHTLRASEVADQQALLGTSEAEVSRLRGEVQKLDIQRKESEVEARRHRDATQDLQAQVVRARQERDDATDLVRRQVRGVGALLASWDGAEHRDPDAWVPWLRALDHAQQGAAAEAPRWVLTEAWGSDRRLWPRRAGCLPAVLLHLQAGLLDGRLPASPLLGELTEHLLGDEPVAPAAVAASLTGLVDLAAGEGGGGGDGDPSVSWFLVCLWQAARVLRARWPLHAQGLVGRVEALLHPRLTAMLVLLTTDDADVRSAFVRDQSNAPGRLHQAGADVAFIGLDGLPGPLVVDLGARSLCMVPRGRARLDGLTTLIIEAPQGGDDARVPLGANWGFYVTWF